MALYSPEGKGSGFRVQGLGLRLTFLVIVGL